MVVGSSGKMLDMPARKMIGKEGQTGLGERPERVGPPTKQGQVWRESEKDFFSTGARDSPILFSMKCFLRASIFALLGLLSLPVFGEQFRTWTSTDGKKLSASLIHADSKNVIFKMKGGREAKVPLTRLVEADQKLIAAKLKAGKAFEIEAIPEATQAPRELDVSGGPRVFTTPHFQFETDQDVLRGFIAEAARVYEGTYYALNGLPLGLKFSPPEGKSHFKGRFMSDSAFDQIANSKMPSLPGQRVVGLYLGKEQELLVPYSSLGAVRRGDRLSLRKSSDTTTLIHEIVHQVMHEWLPVIPTWFSEGMAEYISAIPYQNGRFDFSKAESGLLHRLEKDYGIKGQVSSVIRPSSYFEKYLSPSKGEEEKPIEKPDKNLNSFTANPNTRQAGPDGWTGNVKEYRDAMLTVYFFMHLYDQRNAGAPVGAYLRMVDSSMEDTEKVKEILKSFEKEVEVYNAGIDQFNAALTKYRAEVAAYNERVTKYNEQGEAGVPEKDRIKVGEIPVEPPPPGKLDVPPEIEAARFGGVIDLPAMVKHASLPGLLQGRKLEELDQAMKAAFADIGLQIQYK